MLIAKKKDLTGFLNLLGSYYESRKPDSMN